MATYFLLGWGIVIPFAFYFPYLLLQALEVRSIVIKMSSGTSAFVVGLRTIEAMYGTSPLVVETNMRTYMIYYSSLLPFIWNPATGTRQKISSSQLLRNVASFLLSLLLLSAVLSLEMHYNFEPLGASPVHLQSFHVGWDLLSWKHVGNMYGLAVLTYATLSFGFGLTALGEQLKGCYATEPIFLNPLLTSSSPTDFWGRKWNRMIHILLKHSVFKPSNQFVTTPWAIFVTFVASGILHEYIWRLMFFRYEKDGPCHTDSENVKIEQETKDCYVPALFKLTAFFAWNGIVMLLENRLGAIFRPLSSLMPLPLVSTFVLLSALPVSHWYTGDWVHGGYFAQLSLGVWILRQKV